MIYNIIYNTIYKKIAKRKLKIFNIHNIMLTMKVKIMEIYSKLYIAKSEVTNSYWLPLWIHHIDTYNVMQYLLDEFVSDSITISCALDRTILKKTALFLSLVHDIGKATVGFQYKIAFSVPERAQLLKHYLDIPDRMDVTEIQNTPHAYTGESILIFNGCPESIAAVVGSHHGVPAELAEDLTCNRKDIVGYRVYFGDTDKNRSNLEGSWNCMIQEALVKSGFDSIRELPDINAQAQMLLCGLLITADWIASNTELFPLISIDDDDIQIDFEKRTLNALDNLNFTEQWNAERTTYSDKDFEETFGFLPRAVQKCIIEIAQNADHPGLFILEAPMGCGKTEAALSCAELIASKCKKNGLFFGMPTQATANGIFPRVINWAEKQSEEFYHCVQLQHGNAALNETFQKIQKGIPEEESDSGIIVHSWFCDSKKSCLADFVVATVDQLLMLALKRRHIMLLHLGLSEKVVIIDEVHAYDAYMNQYLERALQWLGAYHTPVILLSATLPSKRRMSLVRAYLDLKTSDEIFEKNISYPLLTWTDGGKIMQKVLPYNADKKTIHISKCNDKDIIEIVRSAVSSGGCVGIIMNTVSRAQSTTKLIKNEITDNVLLYHAQYIMPDRAAKEEILLERIGSDSKSEKRQGLVVIGTQVLEQSLDIDFDILITDICPVDLLLQRIGRLHRHTRKRPDELKIPVCYVLTDEYEDDNSGSKSIYGTWLLKETLEHIPDIVTLPDDISPLVQKVYDSFDDSDEYKNYKNKKDISVRKASSFLLKKPTCRNIHGMLERTVNDSQAEASVRDGTSSIEVLALKLYRDGTIGFLDDRKLSGAMTEEECRRIASQSLRLPGRFSGKWCIDKTIAELENKCKPYTSAWQKQYLLKDKLVLFFDEDNKSELAGYTLRYDFIYGLTYEKE